MTSAPRSFTGIAATKSGQSQQLDRIFKNMARNLKSRNAAQPVELDEPQTLADAKRVIAHLRNQLADAQNLIDDMRAQANSDAPTVTASTEFWDTATVARKSGNVSISTICRNAVALGGTKLGGDWMFPVGTTYGKRRKSK